MGLPLAPHSGDCCHRPSHTHRDAGGDYDALSRTFSLLRPPPLNLYHLATTTISSTMSNSYTSATSSDHPTVRNSIIIVVAVVGVILTVWSLLLAGGLLSYRRNSLQVSTPPSRTSADLLEKSLDGTQRPRLWEISLKSVNQEDYHESLHVSYSLNPSLVYAIE